MQGCEVLCAPELGDLHLAPGAVDIEEDKQLAVPLRHVLAVVALELPGFGKIGCAPRR